MSAVVEPSSKKRKLDEAGLQEEIASENPGSLVPYFEEIKSHVDTALGLLREAKKIEKHLFVMHSHTGELMILAWVIDHSVVPSYTDKVIGLLEAAQFAYDGSVVKAIVDWLDGKGWTYADERIPATEIGDAIRALPIPVPGNGLGAMEALYDPSEDARSTHFYDVDVKRVWRVFY